MGKSKTKIRKKKKSCPTGLQSVRDIEKEEEEMGCLEASAVDDVANPTHASIKSAVKILLEKLQSVGVEDKECACLTLASLSEQTEALPLLLEHKVVKATAPLMTVSSAVVRHAATGALRNLSACGDHDVGEAMVEQDVMTPLVALFKKQYAPGWQPQKPVEGKIDSIKETFTEAVHLLCNLCESSNKAVRVFNKEQLVTFLLPCVDVETYGHRAAIAVAYCLHTVSEDNAELVEKLSEIASVDVFNNLLCRPAADAGSALLKVLSSGIIVNMHSEELSRCTPVVLGNLMKGLSDALDVNVTPLVMTTAEKLSSSQERSSIDESVEWILSAQQIALEVLINICCSNDDGDNWDDLGSSDTSDDIPCFDVNMDDDDGSALKFPLSVSAEVHERIVSHEFLKKVLTKVSVLTEDVGEALRKSTKGRKLCKKLLTLQIRALLCVNNLTTCLDIHDLGGPSHLYELWVNLGQLAFRQTDQSQSELLEATTSAMSAILKKLTEIKSTQFEQFSLQDMQRLCELVQHVPDPRIRTNGIRIFGSLGCLLGSSTAQNSISLLKAIGTFLLDVCNKDKVELWVESEALDALFDVFADDHLDPVLHEIGGVDKLNSILPIFKHKISVQGKNLGEHLPIVMTAKTNLVRFIKYKTMAHSGNGVSHP